VPGASSDTGVPGSDGSAALFSVISALDQHVGETVRVGGRVVSVVPSADAATDASITVDDGTGQAAVRLTGTAAALIDQLATGDLVNVVGTVAMTAAGSVEITVDEASKVARIPAPASLAAASALATTIAVDGQLPPTVGDDSRTSSSSSPSPLLLVAGLLTLLGLTLGGFAAAGPQRRARFVAALITARAALRARIARAPQARDQG
jgi:acyl-CoA hydrolase